MKNRSGKNLHRLTLENITKTYKQSQKVLNSISLVSNLGEMLVVLGPSGCGKSTLLRIIAGLETQEAGHVLIDNEAIDAQTPSERNIAMVFQNYALYPHMNVRQNLSYGLKNRKIKKDEIQKRVDEVARMLQIEELLDRKPSQLSGGQRQRVAMGRALVRKPKVFLFDEPLSNLDAKLRHQMRLEIKKLHRELKITSLFVTHDQVEAMTLADRIVILNNGKIQQIGTPHEIYYKPANTFVAQFIGSPPMNIIPCSAIKETESFEAMTKMIPEGTSPNILIGFRPEHATLRPQKEALRLKGTIDLIELLGSDTLLYISCVGQKVVAKIREGNHEDALNIGSEINIYIPRKQLYFFDRNGDVIR